MFGSKEKTQCSTQNKDKNEKKQHIQNPGKKGVEGRHRGRHPAFANITLPASGGVRRWYSDSGTSSTRAAHWRRSSALPRGAVRCSWRAVSVAISTAWHSVWYVRCSSAMESFSSPGHAPAGPVTRHNGCTEVRGKTVRRY